LIEAEQLIQLDGANRNQGRLTMTPVLRVWSTAGSIAFVGICSIAALSYPRLSACAGPAASAPACVPSGAGHARVVAAMDDGGAHLTLVGMSKEGSAASAARAQDRIELAYRLAQQGLREALMRTRSGAADNAQTASAEPAVLPEPRSAAAAPAIKQETVREAAPARRHAVRRRHHLSLRRLVRQKRAVARPAPGTPASTKAAGEGTPYALCSTFKTFDAASGTYRGYDGQQHRCTPS
jgi:hypothetical protein